MSVAVEVAVAALVEVGRPDLAQRVYENKAGMPSIEHGTEEREVVVRAFTLGHLAAGHRARVASDGEELYVWCRECRIRSDRSDWEPL